MKQSITELLICPSCLPAEKKLVLNIFKKEDKDIICGELKCNGCGISYPIKEGIPFLLPENFKQGETGAAYEDLSVISSYLHSHYSMLSDNHNTGCAYEEWASKIKYGTGLAIDMGCSVGRMTFEMACKFDFAIGMDFSEGFIKKARDFTNNGCLRFQTIKEGYIMEDNLVNFSGKWDKEKVEFIVGDVHAAPFPANSFSCVTSLNIIDKIPSPLIHLKEINRLAKKSGAQLLFSDPFSWSDENADKKDWLGGKHDGRFNNDGFNNILEILKGRYNISDPPFSIEEKGHIWWKIKKHQNLFELIRSCYAKAIR